MNHIRSLPAPDPAVAPLVLPGKPQLLGLVSEVLNQTVTTQAGT